MRQGRKTTQEERIRMAEECIGSGKNYGEMALKYQVSYQQVCKWTLRFEEAVARSAYYKWASGRLSRRAAENERLAGKIENIHAESPDKGYRRLNDDLRHDHGIHVNDKRVLRICRSKDIRSTVKYNNHGCTRRAKNPQYTAENLLDRQFHADKPNKKWLTDVTEFKWYEGITVHKIYLSAILDLCDRRIVSYVLSERNDNPLVYRTFDKAVKANPDAHPLFHSDRGFQYTSRVFHYKLQQAGLTQNVLCGALYRQWPDGGLLGHPKTGALLW